MTYLDLDEIGSFKPFARYNYGMDAMVYRAIEGTCVAQRVDGFLTLLWDAQRTKLVGLRLKGFRSVFLQLNEEYSWGKDFLPLVKVLEDLVASGLGDDLLDEQRQQYDQARTFVDGFYLGKEQLAPVLKDAA